VNQNNVVTSLTSSISGLSPNTDYYWWVRAVYQSNTSDWVGESFSTQGLSSVVWEENFTGLSTIPAGWFQENNWNVGTTSALNPSAGNYIYHHLQGTITETSFSTINIGPLGENDRLKF